MDSVTAFFDLKERQAALGADGELHIEIAKRPPPAQRLEQALRMNRQMRSLMDAALHAEHPEWTPEQRRRAIAERILHARTG